MVMKFLRRLFKRKNAMYVGVAPDPLCVDNRRWRQELYCWRLMKQS
jgi:hypothetical protein